MLEISNKRRGEKWRFCRDLIRASGRRSVVALRLNRCRKSLCILDIIRRRDFLPNLHVHFCICRSLPSPSASSRSHEIDRDPRRRQLQQLFLTTIAGERLTPRLRYRAVARYHDSRASFPSNFRDARGVIRSRANYDGTRALRTTLERRSECARARVRPRIV